MGKYKQHKSNVKKVGKLRTTERKIALKDSWDWKNLAMSDLYTEG